MLEGITVESQRRQEPTLPSVPTPRVSPENSRPGTARRHRAPALGELITTAMMVIRRDSLAPSGFLVVQRKGVARHQHSVWDLGPFALLEDGWFGQVHGRDADSRSKWLRKHERRCAATHWTQFHWIDPALLDAGCGAANIGLGLSSEGPTYCPGHRPGQMHPAHIPLVDIFTDGLRQLAAVQAANDRTR